MFKWPLAQNNFSWLDRLKICKFFLTKSNRWTQDKYVRKYEDLVTSYVGCRYAVFVSSGSTANQLICQKVKDDLIKNNQWPARNRVVVNSVTWQTNVSVWAREGFEPIFIDVNLKDFCLDYKKLERYLKENHESVACVFPTSVIGFTPDIQRLKKLEQKYLDIKFALDNCENFMGTCGSYTNGEFGCSHNICFPFTSSTSCFVAHQISNGQEGGFIFTNNEEEYEYYLLSRAHGLLRNLISYQHKFKSQNYEEAIGYSRVDTLSNPLVDKQFDFQTLSSNYRSSDIAAFMGILDFKRINKYKNHRINIYNFFRDNIDRDRYLLPDDRKDTLDVAFCLPIILLGSNKEDRVKKIRNILNENGIEVRGFISGNMLRQLPYQKYGDYKTLENAEYLNNFAMYIGLNMDTTKKQILELINILNKI